MTFTEAWCDTALVMLYCGVVVLLAVMLYTVFGAVAFWSVTALLAVSLIIAWARSR